MKDELIKGLVRERRKLNISQQAMAEKLGIARESLSKIENLHYDPSVDLLARYIGELSMEVKLIKKQNND